MCVVHDPGNLSARLPQFLHGSTGPECRWKCSRQVEFGIECTYFFTLNARSGRLSKSAIQYPLIRNRKAKKPCTAASGTM